MIFVKKQVKYQFKDYQLSCFLLFLRFLHSCFFHSSSKSFTNCQKTVFRIIASLR